MSETAAPELWIEIAQSPEFETLGPREKRAVAEQFFDRAIAPNAPPERAESLRVKFLHRTGLDGVVGPYERVTPPPQQAPAGPPMPEPGRWRESLAELREQMRPQPPAPERPSRWQTAASQFVQGAGQMATSALRSVALLGKPDPELVEAYAAIDALREEDDPDTRKRLDEITTRFMLDDLGALQRLQAYRDAPPEKRTEVLAGARRELLSATDHPAWRAADKADEYLAGLIESNPEYADEFVAGSVPYGLGSVVGFIAAGAMSRGALTRAGVPAKLAAAAGPAGLGAQVNQVDVFRDALDSGATIEEAYRAGNAGRKVGLLEGVPIANLFDRLDAASGGSVKRVLLDMLKQGSEEAFQEAVTQLSTNLIASDLVGYDPERRMWQGTGEAAGVGFTTGALVEFLGSMLTGGRRRGSSRDGQPQDAAGVAAEPTPVPGAVEADAIAVPQGEDPVRAFNAATGRLPTSEEIAHFEQHGAFPPPSTEGAPVQPPAGAAPPATSALPADPGEAVPFTPTPVTAPPAAPSAEAMGGIPYEPPTVEQGAGLEVAPIESQPPYPGGIDFTSDPAENRRLNELAARVEQRIRDQDFELWGRQPAQADQSATGGAAATLPDLASPDARRLLETVDRQLTAAPTGAGAVAAAVEELGGIDRQSAAALGVDPEVLPSRQAGTAALFPVEGGRPVEAIRDALAEQGLVAADTAPRDVLDLVLRDAPPPGSSARTDTTSAPPWLEQTGLALPEARQAVRRALRGGSLSPRQAKVLQAVLGAAPQQEAGPGPEAGAEAAAQRPAPSTDSLSGTPQTQPPEAPGADVPASPAGGMIEPAGGVAMESAQPAPIGGNRDGRARQAPPPPLPPGEDRPVPGGRGSRETPPGDGGSESRVPGSPRASGGEAPSTGAGPAQRGELTLSAAEPAPLSARTQDPANGAPAAAPAVSEGGPIEHQRDQRGQANKLMARILRSMGFARELYQRDADGTPTFAASIHRGPRRMPLRLATEPLVEEIELAALSPLKRDPQSPPALVLRASQSNEAGVQSEAAFVVTEGGEVLLATTRRRKDGELVEGRDATWAGGWLKSLWDQGYGAGDVERPRRPARGQPEPREPEPAVITDEDLEPLAQGPMRSDRGVLPARADEQRGPGMAAETVRQAIAGDLRRWKAAPRVEVVASHGQLPEVLAEFIRQQGATDTVGLYHPGASAGPTVYLVASRIRSEEHARRVLAHEVVGHYGMEAALGPEFQRILEYVQSLKYTDPVIEDLARRVQRNYGDLPPVVESAEIVAALAEDGVQHPLLVQLRDWIRQLLRKLGIEVAFSRGELEALVVRAARMLASGEMGRAEAMARAREARAPRLARDGGDGAAPGAPDAAESGEQGYSAAWNLDDETRVERFLRIIQDKMVRLKVAQTRIAEATGTRRLPDEINAYQAEELFHGKLAADFEQFEREFIEPLAQEMARRGVSREELDLWIYAQHAPERNAYIATIRDDLPDGGSGMTDAEARAITEQAMDEGKAGDLIVLAQRVHDLLEEARTRMLDAGLIEQGTVDAWRATYQHYVPLKGFAADEDAERQGMKTGRGFSITGKESLRALGRRSMADSPLLNAIRDASEKLVRARKNEVGQVFLNLVRQYPNPEVWEIHTDGNAPTRRTFDESRGEVVERPVDMRNARDADGDPEFFQVREDGRTHFIRIKDRRLNKAMHNLGVEKLSKSMEFLVRTVGTATRFLSMVNTTLNPEFLVSNAARDAQAAIFNVLAEQQLGDGRAHGKRLTAAMLRDYWPSMRAFWRGQRGGEGESDQAREFDRFYREFREDGAMTGWNTQRSVREEAARLERLAALAGGGLKTLPRKAFGDLVQVIEDANLAVENAVRLSVYVNARRQGVTRPQAASLAKNLTINFNRRGEATTAINSLYMFFNAAVQGNAQFLRSVATDPRKHGGLTHAQWLALGMSSAAVGIALLNMARSDDDEDGDSFYSKIPEYEKERNLIVMRENGQDYVKFPLPYGYSVFHVLGTTMAEMAFEGLDGAKAGLRIFHSIFDSFSPIGLPESDEPVRTAIKAVTPTVGVPLMDLAMNENHFGAPIYRTNFPGSTRPLPDSSMAMRSTSEYAKLVAQFLNAATGGRQGVEGMIDVSPDAIEHLLGYATGGFGRTAMRSVNLVDKTARGLEDDLTVRDVPFLRLVMGAPAPWVDSQRYYDRRHHVRQVANQARLLWEGGDTQAARAWEKENADLLELAEVSTQVEKELRRIRKERREIEDDTELGVAERQDLLAELEEAEREEYLYFNGEWNKLIRGEGATEPRR